MNRPVLIFVIWVCALISCANHQPKPVANASVPTPTGMPTNNNVGQPSKSDRKYTRGVAGEGSKGARGASFITLNSSDGMRFTKWSTHYETSERAALELQGKLQTALEIVSRQPTLDVNAHAVGETVVARFASTNREVGPASLLWTAGSELFQVDSSSIKNILEYRKDFHH